MNKENMERMRARQLKDALGTPPAAATASSRRRIEAWFAQTAPLCQWDVVESPLGALYVAARDGRLCSVDFGVSEAAFVGRLDPLARTERNPAALVDMTGQLRTYFGDTRFQFDLPLDLERLTPFQQHVLATIRRIPVGSVWTYGQVARAIGKPRASRAVGQALGRNPMPIVIPCHRVIAGDGGLGGYSGGGGLASKQLLLKMEGVLMNGA
jgi:methylated-DNA-[protein]-cysteine S-methyltransferase